MAGWCAADRGGTGRNRMFAVPFGRQEVPDAQSSSDPCDPRPCCRDGDPYSHGAPRLSGAARSISKVRTGDLLRSAIPKGPSLDPGEKRLAVHVEDHPLDYGGFEGVIPKGQYGGGTVLLWDRGTWTPEGPNADEAYRKGSLKFRLDGEKLHGSWALVRMGGRAAGERRENWLLIKERDDVAVPHSGSALVEENPLSVATGRSMEAIANARDRVWDSQKGEIASEPPKAKPAKKLGASRPPGARRRAMPSAITPQLAT